MSLISIIKREHLQRELNQAEFDQNMQAIIQLQTLLWSEGTATNVLRLNGQLPEYYATSQDLQKRLRTDVNTQNLTEDQKINALENLSIQRPKTATTRGSFRLKSDFDFTFPVEGTDYSNSDLEIIHDFDLLGEIITLPENIKLIPKGGIIRNCTLIGDKTKIDKTNEQLFDNVTFDGTFDLKESTPQLVGAKLDGLNDDSTAIINSFKLSNKIYLKAGNYNIDTLMQLSLNDFHLYGDEGGSTIISSSNLINLINIQDSKNLTFENIKFETTVVDAIENTLGLIYSGGANLTNIKFIKCIFSCQNANVNALKFINQSVELIDNMTFDDCDFENIGRMAIEFQNHEYINDLKRYKNITIKNSRFTNVGTIDYGMGVSFSGNGDNCVVKYNTFNNVRLGIEAVGVDNLKASFNTFNNFITDGTPFSTGSLIRQMSGHTIDNNTSNGSQIDIRFWNQEEPVFFNNKFVCESTSKITIRDTNNIKATNENYITKSNNVLFFEGVSENNSYNSSSFSNLLASINSSVVRVSGVDVSKTKFIDCSFIKGTGGVIIDTINSGQLPEVLFCTESLNYKQFHNSRIGLTHITSVNKSSGTGQFTNLNINLGTTSSWLSGTIKVNVVANAGNGQNNAFCQEIIRIKQSGSTLQVVNQQTIGVSQDLTITTAISGTSLVLTATHADTSSLQMLWSCEVTSTNFPIIT